MTVGELAVLAQVLQVSPADLISSQTSHLSGASRLTVNNAADAAPDSGLPAGVLATVPSVLVGRESEMVLLTGLIKEVARGHGSSVLIEGEPGIGKSALVRAAVAEAPEAGCQVFWGAGDELGQALPLLPFLDGLRVREPSANPRRNTIVRLLRGEVSADRGTDVPAVLAEQLLALIAEQCAVRPTILVVDDLQWADQASITLWGRLARSARLVPLLLVGMMRPAPQREDLLALRRAAGEAARLQLTALTEVAVADLVATLAGGRPDGNLLRLADGAAGNPLYLTELVAALARSSTLAITEAGAAELTSGSAPGSLSAAIADRLGFVTGPVREVLRAAALLGMDFAVPDLAIVLGRGVADLSPGGRRGMCRRCAGRVRPRLGVPASADPGGAVRRDACAGARRLAPRRGPRSCRGGRAGRPGGPADAAGRRRTRRYSRGDGRVDARLAGRHRGPAGRLGARGGSRAPRASHRSFPGRLGPARLAGQPARRCSLPHR